MTAAPWPGTAQDGGPGGLVLALPYVTYLTVTRRYADGGAGWVYPPVQPARTL